MKKPTAAFACSVGLRILPRLASLLEFLMQSLEEQRSHKTDRCRSLISESQCPCHLLWAPGLPHLPLARREFRNRRPYLVFDFEQEPPVAPAVLQSNKANSAEIDMLSSDRPL